MPASTHLPAWRGARVLLGLLLVLAAGCPFDPAAPARCVASDNCPRGYDCVDGFCTRQDDPSTLDGATLDGGVVRLDGALADQGPRDRDAAPRDMGAAADLATAADRPASDGGTASDALAGDGTSLDGASTEAGASDAAGDAGAVLDTGPVCDPASCPSSPDPCLRPTCGASGCTFTTANDNTACPAGICRSGQCEALCWIDGDTVQSGALLAAGGCLACRPELDAYAYSPLDPFAACSDGLWCTGSDQCSGEDCVIVQYTGDGRCGGGTPRCDEDHDRCVQCLLDIHCSSPTPRCKTDTGTCVACLSPADCPDDSDVCTTTSCTGNVCGQTNNSLSCTDGLWCTGTDTCSAGDCTLHQYPGTGGCTGNTPYCDEDSDRCVQCLLASNCADDSNVCTTRVCTDGTCGQSNNTASCDDTLWCNGTDTCSGGGCNTHQYVNRCSTESTRTLCNDTLDRCECGASPLTCPALYACNLTSGHCRRTATLTLASINEDGLQDPFGNNVDFSWITLDSVNHWGALRYQLANVPRGASILAASLTVYVDSAAESLANETISIENVASAAALVEGPSYISGRTRATTTVTWNQALATQGWHTSPDLKSLIQLIVNRSDWNPGQSVLLIFNHRINTDRFEFRQYDYSDINNSPGAFAATLSLTYELP